MMRKEENPIKHLLLSSFEHITQEQGRFDMDDNGFMTLDSQMRVRNIMVVLAEEKINFYWKV